MAAIATEEVANVDYENGYCSFVAYFFCKDTDERLRTDSSILAHLLAQMLDQYPRILSHFEKEPDYKKEQEKTNWDSGMLWRVFERIWTDDSLGRTCFIIDAIGTFYSVVD